MSRPAILRAKDTANVFGMMRTRTFVLLYIGLTFSGIAIYIAFVFLPAFAADVGASRVAGAALIGYIGASSVVGRLGLNALAPRFGLLNMYKTSYLILLMSSYFWLTGPQLHVAGHLRIGHGRWLRRYRRHVSGGRRPASSELKD